MSSPTPPGSPDRPVGTVLHRAREGRGLTLAEVSQATGIRSSYLDALENDASEDAFPGRVYARFFLREYARYLRVPDGPLVEALDARWFAPDEEAPSLASALGLAEVRRPRPWLGKVVTTLAVVALVVVLVTIVAASGGSSRQNAPLASGGAPASPTHVSPSPARSSSPSPSSVGSIVARITATDGRCWVRAVAADGTELFQDTLEAGQRTTVSSRRAIGLDLGAAQYVRLVVNGQTIPAGENVVRLTLSLRDGRVVVS